MIKNMSIISIRRRCGFVLLANQKLQVELEETLMIEKEIEKRCEEHFKKYSKRLEEIERKLENKVDLGDVVALI